MIVKKNPKADVARLSGLFYNVGLIVALLLCITAFEWKFYDNLETIDLGQLEDSFDETIEIPVTEMPPPPAPVLQQPEIVEVKDEEEIKQDIQVNMDVEVQQDAVPDVPVKIDAPPPPPPVEEKEDEIFLVVEENAEPVGGMQKFYEFVSKNLEYPKQARRMGVEGRVVIQMVVDKDGTLTDPKVLKGIGSGCDEEAVRVLKSSPKWKPGKQRGKPVKVKVTVPIIFKLS